MPTELEKRISNFNYYYRVKLSVDRLENTLQKKLKYYDNVLINKKDNNPELKKYLSGLTRTLAECIKAKIKINDGADYHGGINLLSFIRDYEGMMKARKEETEYDRERRPYEGADYDKLVKYVVNSTREYDQALCWIWAEDVVNDKLSIKDLQAVTDSAIADLDKVKAGEFTDREWSKLANVYWAMKAMEMVRQQRGVFFRIFSFRINRREKEYFNQLVAAKDRYIAKGFPVAELQKVAYVSVMKESYEEVEKGLQAQKKGNEIKIEKAEKLRNLPKVVDMIQPLTQDTTLKNKVVDEIVAKLPTCRWEKSLQKMMVASTMIAALIKTVQEANQAFDEDVAQGRNPQILMEHNVKMVFQKAYLFTDSLGYTEQDKHKKILAAQVMTDVIMKNFSPVVMDGEVYAKFSDGYMLNDRKAFEEVTELNSNEEYFLTAKKNYEELKREEIKMPELNPIANENVVEPVEQSSNVKEPIIVKK